MIFPQGSKFWLESFIGSRDHQTWSSQAATKSHLILKIVTDLRKFILLPLFYGEFSSLKFVDIFQIMKDVCLQKLLFHNLDILQPSIFKKPLISLNLERAIEREGSDSVSQIFPIQKWTGQKTDHHISMRFPSRQYYMSWLLEFNISNHIMCALEFS